MTARVILTKVLQQGKNLVQNVLLKTQKQPTVKAIRNVKQVRRADAELKPEPWQRFSQGSRWYRSYYNTVASRLRRQAAWGVGRSTVLAFAGGLTLTSQQQQDSEIVQLIRESLKGSEEHVCKKVTLQEALSVHNFQFGEMIGKGCNGAVYQVKLTSETVEDIVSADASDIAVLDLSEEDMDESSDWTVPQIPDLTEEWSVLDAPSDLQSEIESLELETEEVESSCEQSFCIIEESDCDSLSVDSLPEEVVTQHQSGTTTPGEEESTKFDLAVKMIFNYEIESNADKIKRSMEKEMLPAPQTEILDRTDNLENGHEVNMKRLPPHPNIVDIRGVFVDNMPLLPGAREHYPAALPQCYNDKGFGRNKTLFMVMKKYDMTLREYLFRYEPTTTTRLILIAQLIEAVVHLSSNRVAHRDMKSDNIFIDCPKGDYPRLVLGDFGCCLTDSNNGLRVPYLVEDIDKGGNTALMAPEIKCCKPGWFSVLDYSKADLWGVGALAYEILGLQNPFYLSQSGPSQLKSEIYRETQLPPLPDNTLPQLKQLTQCLLSRDPHKRPSAAVAANIIHILLWWPKVKQWLPGLSDKQQINWWLSVMAMEVKLWQQKARFQTENLLKRTFLNRLNRNDLNEAFRFVREFSV